MWALSPLPLYLILGWSLGAWGLEHRPAPPDPPVRFLTLPGAGQELAQAGVEPLDLRCVAGVGRTRSRDLAQGFWERGWGPAELESSDLLERIPGIGPVTAAAVERWAASGAPGAYTDTQEINPAPARLPPQITRVHRKRATARPAARQTPRPAQRIP